MLKTLGGEYTALLQSSDTDGKITTSNMGFIGDIRICTCIESAIPQNIFQYFIKQHGNKPTKSP